ncbi:CPBP family intramembrane glutamic endopeptidase [Microbacterium sp.]|uniref:CPBP family intramembrane glutamic endopeptidase n=1 Tax=Microbacterium sp. TaxID=51671 RepID=UPI002E329171|nr:CPBP family intramembrane glutamic endopeptidase [Microbacterium sp.]HEX5729032.1 CPBP family intramembrane glutamic endopeptidase [Microbacterium sp.]
MTSPNPPFDVRFATDPGVRARLWWEIGIVLAITVGQSALYSVLSLVRASLRTTPISQQQAQLNPNRDAEILWNVLYQFLDVVFALALVALVVYLLWEPGRSALGRIGLDFTRFGGDLGRGILLAAVIGIPGLGLYVLARVMGLNVAVVASPLDAAWWTLPLLLFSALRAGLTEEVILVAYLFDRLRRLGWSWWAIILSAAALRGAYHAYQGIGAIVGNFVMGVVFGWCYRRWGRVMPLVIAHTLLDIVAFVGYPLAAALWPGVFAPAPSPSPTPSLSPSPSPAA